MARFGAVGLVNGLLAGWRLSEYPQQLLKFLHRNVYTLLSG